VIHYEFPLNERVRTLLRLEDLFARFDEYARGDRGADHHSALLVVFEIMDVAGRADLKSDLLQELERQKQVLESLRSNPAVAIDKLDDVLTEIDSTMRRLLGMSGRIGQHIRDNEWLMGIKQRTSIPGGTCEFDVPSYHYWLNQSAVERRQSLLAWVAPLRPLQEGLAIVLRLLRDSGREVECLAAAGSYQQMANGRVAQLLVVELDETIPCVPELSANKYMINVRFIGVNLLGGERQKQSPLDIPFSLVFCNL